MMPSRPWTRRPATSARTRVRAMTRSPRDFARQRATAPSPGVASASPDRAQPSRAARACFSEIERWRCRRRSRCLLSWCCKRDGQGRGHPSVRSARERVLRRQARLKNCRAARPLTWWPPDPGDLALMRTHARRAGQPLTTLAGAVVAGRVDGAALQEAAASVKDRRAN
jgi:hypothetical protein